VTGSRLPAIITTSVALVLLNVGIAWLIVGAIGVEFAPLWLALVILAAGVLAAAGAVMLWRGYLRAL